MTKRMGIERQALWLAMTPVIVLAVLLDSYFIFVGFHNLDQMLMDRSNMIARQVVALSEFGVFSENRTLLQQQVDAAFSQAEVKSIVVRNRDQQVLASAGRLADQSHHQADFMGVSQILEITQPIFPTAVWLDEAVDTSSTKVALGSVTIEMSKVKIIRDKFYLLGINLALTFIVLLISMWAVRRSSRRTTLPIVMMNDTVRRLGEGDLAERISSPTDIEEIQQLAVGINQMAEQLQFERRQLEQKVQAATLALRQKVKEEEEANFNKTRFLAAASHDLRQPIHALGLFVGQIQELMVSAEQKQVAERIEKSVQAMSGLLDSLLDVSKLDAGVVVPHLQQVDLDSILRRLAADYSAISFEKNLRLSVAPTAYTVYSDPQLLARILGNLLSNAVRYTPRNGTIFIGCRRRGERVKIEVRDNGIGIEPSQHQAIFAEFVQLANKQRDRSQGLGLGLSIVQRLVSLLGHHLALKSAPNLGSTFTLELNLFDGQGQSALVRKDRRLLRRSNPKFTQQKILVVDDDGLVRESTKGIVESWGFQVTIAETVVDAIQLCQSVAFELVISDYRLPDGNGLQVAEYFKLHAKLPPKFILVTGDASPDILISINKLGFNVMNKPVRPANLRSLIVHLLNTNVSS